MLIQPVFDFEYEVSFYFINESGNMDYMLKIKTNDANLKIMNLTIGKEFAEILILRIALKTESKEWMYAEQKMEKCYW